MDEVDFSVITCHKTVNCSDTVSVELDVTELKIAEINH